MTNSNKSVYVVDGSRTPFLKVRGKPGLFTASDLAVGCGRALLARQPFKPSEFDEVILGCAMPSPDEANIGRVASLRLGCGKKVPAWTVMRNCASGMQALDSAFVNISSGRSKLVLAGGVDSMSYAPVLFNKEMVSWLGDWYGAKTLPQRLKLVAQFRLKFLTPVIGLLRGLTDPVVGLNMGQTAENLAYRFGITRKDMDAYAVESHRRLAQSQDNGYLKEVEPLYAGDGKIYTSDDGIRRDSSIENLAKLKPFFDKKFGSVTPGNSSQVTDGAAWLILADEEMVNKYNLKPLGKIIDSQWAGVDPAQMGVGPVHAMTPILKRHQFNLDDIDAWEINEAFAAQVLACIAAWQDADYCRNELDLEHPLGKLDIAKLNIDGGAVSIGHPVGASGARITLHLLHVLRRIGGKRGIASLCIGGGQGGAMLVEV